MVNEFSRIRGQALWLKQINLDYHSIKLLLVGAYMWTLDFQYMKMNSCKRIWTMNITPQKCLFSEDSTHESYAFTAFWWAYILTCQWFNCLMKDKITKELNQKLSLETQIKDNVQKIHFTHIISGVHSWKGEVINTLIKCQIS